MCFIDKERGALLLCSDMPCRLMEDLTDDWDIGSFSWQALGRLSAGIFQTSSEAPMGPCEVTLVMRSFTF